MVIEPLPNQISKLVEARRFREAAGILATRAAQSDAEALVTLALWRINGSIIRRDLSAARELLERAGSLGRADAALLHSYFLAAGVGGADDWPRALSQLEALRGTEPAARQIGLIKRMALSKAGYPVSVPEGRVLSERPFATAFESLLTKEECDYLREQAGPKLTRSVVIHPTTGQPIPHPVRKSSGTSFGVFDEDLVVNALNRRFAAITQTRPQQGESLQVLRYQRGDEYRAHMDALPAEANQRVLTLLVYLSDDYGGGETRFLKTGLSFKGKVGDALLFRNVNAAGEPDPLSEHAGCPVTAGVKLIASRWIRKEPFKFPPPQPLLPGV